MDEEPLPKSLAIPDPPNKRTTAIQRSNNELLRDQLSKLRFSKKEITDALAFHQFQTDHFSDGIKIVTGGRIKVSTQLLGDIEKMRNELNEFRKNAPALGHADYEKHLKKEALLQRGLQMAIHQYTEFSRDVEKGAIEWANVDAAKDMTIARANRPSVGFKPLAVQINVDGKNVEVREPKTLTDGPQEEGS